MGILHVRYLFAALMDRGIAEVQITDLDLVVLVLQRVARFFQDIVLPGEQRAGLAPTGRDDADLRLLAVLFVAHEGDRATVGRPSGRRILVLAAGECARP